MPAMTTLLRATEADFQNLVVEYAQLKGWMVAHFRPALTQSGRWATPMQGDKGYPDLTMARNGRIVISELKSESGRLTDAQRSWLIALSKRKPEELTTRQAVSPGVNPEVYVWRPSDFEEIKEVLA